jgi:hypothetical protein
VGAASDEAARSVSFFGSVIKESLSPFGKRSIKILAEFFDEISAGPSCFANNYSRINGLYEWCCWKKPAQLYLPPSASNFGQ